MKNKVKFIILFIASLFFYSSASFAQIDDIYFSRKDAEKEVEKREAQRKANEQQTVATKGKQPKIAYVIDTVYIYDEDNYADDPIIVTDENDFVYSQRLNKFHNADINIYTDMDNSAGFSSTGGGTTNIYINSGFGNYYDPYWSSYDPYWGNSFYFGYGYGFWGSSWRYTPWWYSSWYNPWGYSSWYYRPHHYYHSPLYTHCTPYYQHTYRPAPTFRSTTTRTNANGWSHSDVRGSSRTIVRSSDANRSSSTRSSSLRNSDSQMNVRSSQIQSRNTDAIRSSNTQSQRSDSNSSITRGGSNTRSESSGGSSTRSSSGESSRGSSSSSYSSGSSRSGSSSSSYSSGSSRGSSSSGSSSGGGSRSGGSYSGGGRGGR